MLSAEDLYTYCLPTTFPQPYFCSSSSSSSRELPEDVPVPLPPGVVPRDHGQPLHRPAVAAEAEVQRREAVEVARNFRDWKGFLT